MPPAVAAAGIAAGAQLAGGVIQSRGNNRAIDMQERARQEALAYEREREAQAQMRRDAMYNQYRNDYSDWMQQFYGRRPNPQGRGWNVSANEAPGPGFEATNPAAPVVAPVADPAAVPVADPTVTIPTPTGGVPAATSALPPLVPTQPRTLADLGGWSARNFNRYLGR